MQTGPCPDITSPPKSKKPGLWIERIYSAPLAVELRGPLAGTQEDHAAPVGIAVWGGGVKQSETRKSGVASCMPGKASKG